MNVQPDKEKLELAIAAMLRQANSLEAEHDEPSSESYNDYSLWADYTALRETAEWLRSTLNTDCTQH